MPSLRYHHESHFCRKTGKTERIRNESNPIWRQTIVYDRIKLIELEEASLTLSIVHRHRARRKLLGLRATIINIYPSF